VGGPACTVKTVEKMSGVRMDHYLEVDFKGFQKFVDELGGVDITTHRAIKDAGSHLSLSAGKHTLKGEQALALVRTRHGVGDGSDLGRIQLQQTFIKALIHRAESIDVHLPHPAARRPTALSPLGRPPRRPSALLQRRAPQLISPGRAPSPFNDWVAAFR
jgi:anionic cell wall polymer biosynthesis LytR-Cps2A-Psr (LCP) family protein